MPPPLEIVPPLPVPPLALLLGAFKAFSQSLLVLWLLSSCSESLRLAKNQYPAHGAQLAISVLRQEFSYVSLRATIN
jgi:hypothetical protein